MDCIEPLLELSEKTNQHVSTLNTCSVIPLVERRFGQAGIARMFGPFWQEGGIVRNRFHRGKPITVDYFLEDYHWFDYPLVKVMFGNLRDMGFDMRYLGKETVRGRLARRGSGTIRVVQLLGIGPTFRGAARVNRKCNHTKEVYIENITEESGQVVMRYHPGFVHNELITEQNIGSYLAVLEYIGFTVKDVVILEDTVATDAKSGFSRIEFRWYKRGFLKRLRFFLGSWLGHSMFPEYCQSSQVLHDFHSDLLDNYQYQLEEKEALHAEREAQYAATIARQDQLIRHQDQTIQRMEHWERLDTTKRVLGEKFVLWLSHHYANSDTRVSAAAKDLNVSETKLGRWLKDVFEETPVKLLLEFRLIRARDLLEHQTPSVTALSCGFKTLSHFSQRFKERYGVTPTEYRRRFKEEGIGEEPANAWSLFEWQVREQVAGKSGTG